MVCVYSVLRLGTAGDASTDMYSVHERVQHQDFDNILGRPIRIPSLFIVLIYTCRIASVLTLEPFNTRSATWTSGGRYRTSSLWYIYSGRVSAHVNIVTWKWYGFGVCWGT